MRERCSRQRYAEELFSRDLSAFADRFGYLIGFTDANAHVAGAVAHNHYRAEAESTPAFDDLSYPFNLDHAVSQIEVSQVGLVCIKALCGHASTFSLVV